MENAKDTTCSCGRYLGMSYEEQVDYKTHLFLDSIFGESEYVPIY